MNKIIAGTRHLALSLMVLMMALLAWTSGARAASTRFTSNNYAVESVIVGGTGVLHSSYASIPPQIIEGPTVSNIGQTSAEIDWQTDKPSNQVVQIGSITGVYSNEVGIISNTTYLTHTVTLNGLTRGTLYYFRVRSQDVSGNTSQSVEQSFSTDVGDITAPKLIKPVSVVLNTANSIIVTWETDELCNSLVDYGIQKVDDQTVGHPDELTQFHQIQISGLRSQQTYQLRIKSKDSSDNTLVGDVLTVSTLTAPSITEVRISDITLNSAVVEWKTTVATTSKIDYGTSSNYDQLLVDNSGSTTTHLMRLNALQSGTTYYLRISGVDAESNKLLSDEYIFKTVVLPVISGFAVTDVTSNSALLSWTSSSDIDELTRFTVLAADDRSLIGKDDSKGSDVLASKHVLRLTGLESSVQYSASVTGKDIYGNKAIAPSIAFTTLIDHDPPVIENVRTDTTVDLGSQQTVQVLVSFALNELGISHIVFGEGSSGSYTGDITTDTDLSTNKFLVIPELRPGQSYHFKIIAKDRAGNQSESTDYLVLAPSQPISLFDLIFGQVRKNFGWLSNIGGK